MTNSSTAAASVGMATDERSRLASDAAIARIAGWRLCMVAASAPATRDAEPPERSQGTTQICRSQTSVDLSPWCERQPLLHHRGAQVSSQRVLALVKYICPCAARSRIVSARLHAFRGSTSSTSAGCRTLRPAGATPRSCRVGRRRCWSPARGAHAPAARAVASSPATTTIPTSVGATQELRQRLRCRSGFATAFTARRCSGSGQSRAWSPRSSTGSSRAENTAASGRRRCCKRLQNDSASRRRRSSRSRTRAFATACKALRPGSPRRRPYGRCRTGHRRIAGHRSLRRSAVSRRTTRNRPSCDRDRRRVSVRSSWGVATPGGAEA
eukprot:1919561-Prymnesium_polylepis.1